MANTAPISNTIDTRAGAGVAGEVTRRLESTIESIQLDSTDPPTAWGVALKNVAGKFRKIVSGDAAADVVGVLVRTEPSISEADGSSPNLGAIHGLLVKGYVNVVCGSGTPVRGGAVYLRITADPGAIGDFEAADDGAETEPVPGWTWAVSGKDANGIAEVRIA